MGNLPVVLPISPGCRIACISDNDDRASGIQQGRRGCRSLSDAADLEDQDTGACDFDRHREDGDYKFSGRSRSRQPKRCEHAVADNRYKECARRRSAKEKESTKLLAI